MLENKSIVVTGAAGALGQAVVGTLLRAGVRVTALVHDQSHMPDHWHDIAALLTMPLDLLDESAVEQAMATVNQIKGRIDGLICLAGGFFGDTPVRDTPPARLREQLDLNLVSVYTCVHAVLPSMLDGGGGAIVGIGSRPAVRPALGAVAYGVAKLGVLKLMESVAEEYRDQGIRANAILPSIIDTPANRHSMPAADFSRWVDPDQIAAVLSFLMSDAAAIISGAAIPVYGKA